MTYTPGHVFSAEQIDAIEDEISSSPGHEKASHVDVAAYLARLGHPLFAGEAQAQSSLSHAAGEASVPAFGVGAPAGLNSGPEAAGVASPQPPAAPQRHLPSAPADPGDDGLGALDESDMVVPRLRLKQPMSEGDGIDEVKNGWSYLSTDLTDAAETRRLSMLYLSRQRELKLPRGKAMRELVIDRVERRAGRRLEIATDAFSACRSADRIVPAPGVEHPLSTQCEGCPHAQWDAAAKARDCAETYEVAVVDLDTMQPMLATWRGSAVREAKKLNTSISVAKRRYRVPSAHCLEFVLGGAEKPGKDGGKYYVPSFGRVTQIEDEDLVEELAALRDAIRGARVHSESADEDGDS